MIVFILVSYLTFLYSLVVLIQRQWIIHLKKENNKYHALLEERLAPEEHEEVQEAEEEEQQEQEEKDMTETPPSLPQREVKDTYSLQNLPSEIKGEIASNLENQDRENLIAALANPPPLLKQNEEDEDYSDMPPLIPASSMTEPSQDL